VSDTATGPWREALGFIDSLLMADHTERERLLADLAATRPELHTRVRALLDADAEATRTGFLAVNKGGKAAASLAVGTRLGPYRVVRELGSGGMGEVWLAKRDDGLYQGEVAIKTLHPFFAHGAMRERFLREAQLLGKLAHPNIARLLDAGVSDGVVFLVLEYVRGESIDAYCDTLQLGIDARLKLFGEVCAAVSHAHANLIVHRDIKPANILVTAEGQVKLLDFGIGKIMEADGGSTESPELTRVTGRIFTPEFAAPEQILGEPVTTATDVYSLGTLIYVLLAGTRPFGDLSGARVEHAVLHDEPRALSAAAGEVDSSIAGRRGLSPVRLRRALAGDLENIVHLAMRKVPARRYGSVLGLAEDLARHQRHEPVRARVGSRAYRMNRYVRRHRVAVAASLGVILAAAVGVGGVLYQAREARTQARLASREAEKATSIRDYLLTIFDANKDSHPDGAAARLTTAEELMNIATNKVLEQTDGDAEVRLEMMAILHNIQGQFDNFALQERLGNARIALVEKEFGAADIRLADALNDHAELLRARQRFDEARAAAGRGVALREAQGDHASWTRGVLELTLGQIAYGDFAGKSTEPVDHFTAAISILEKLEPSRELVRAHLGLARTYEFVDRNEEAVTENLRGIALAEKVLGPHAAPLAGGHQQLARALGDLYRLEEAELHLQKAVEIFSFGSGPDSGFTTGALLDVGRLKNRRGKYRDATPLLEDVLSRHLKVDGADDNWTQQSRIALFVAAFQSGDFRRAHELIDECDKSLARKANPRVTMSIHRNRSLLQMEEGRYTDAVKSLDMAAAELAKSPQANSGVAYGLLIYRAEALTGVGRIADARQSLLDAEPILANFDDDPDKVDTQKARLARSRVEMADQHPDEARKFAADALVRLQASRRRAEIWDVEELAQRRLAQAEFAVRNPAAACAALDEAIRLRSANALSTDPRLVATRKLRATCT